ncbi:MAG: hypothetical protein A3G84_00310 [Chloroflexi bacterium RIFCSPLOWO2_12_FULL_71_12]|nr:MAG: hypothetical protein A3G84_00310 [Chloroflexi bacterium RIFCSPLOWO2_12_FULL_71_12]
MPVELFAGLAGAMSSFLSGLLGIGGGIVLTPVLLYAPPLFGAAVLPVKIITGLTIVQAISGSALGALRHRRYGNVSMRLVRLMGPTGAAASLAGALLSSATPDRVIVAVFAAFALITVPLLLQKEHDPDRAVDELHVNVPLAVGIAVVVGFFGGMVGIGAIAFILAAMVRLLRIPVRIAIGTSLGMAVFAAFAPITVPLLLQKEHDPDRAVDELHVNVPLAVGIAVVVGFFGGMVGIGAIAFILAAMVRLLRIPVRIAIGTSLGIGMFAAIAGLIGKAATAQIDPTLALIVLLAAVVASPFGAAVSQRTHPRVLMLLLAGVVALAGLRMAWQAIVEMA